MEKSGYVLAQQGDSEVKNPVPTAMTGGAASMPVELGVTQRYGELP